VVQLDAMRNQAGEAIQVAQGSPIRVWVPLAAPCEGALIARLL
jgi:U32 family peptidase